MRKGMLFLALLAVAALVLRPVLTREASEAVFSAQASPNHLIIIDADRQRLILYENGKEIKRYGVAVGKDSTPSPLGVWKIINMRRNWGTGFGTRWMGLDCPWGTFGIHGTNKPGSIGSFASHGCIRMLNRDVEDLYSRIQPGTNVIIERAAYGDLAGPSRGITPGDRGSDVRQLQLRLRAAGFDVGYIDGIYGEATKQMIIDYKRSKGLPLHHTVDYQTKQALGMLLFE